MKLLLEVFSSKQTSAAEGSILILAARKVKVAFQTTFGKKVKTLNSSNHRCL
jgi:hypothetical protein